MYYVSFNLEALRIQIEGIKQDIQGTNSNYLINIPTPNTNIMNTSDDTTKDIKAFLQTNHFYHWPPTTPISQFLSLDFQERLTPDLRAEVCTTTAASATASAPNASSPTTISTLAPEAPLSDSTDRPSNFLSTHPTEKPKK